MSVSRRGFLKGLAGGVLSLGATASASAANQTGSDEVWQHQSENIDIFVDVDLLEQYQPRLVTSHLDIQPVRMSGYIANYLNEDYAYIVYWTEYRRQVGWISIGDILTDSHWGDHEPVYMRVEWDESGPGEIEELYYSGYHWLRAMQSAPLIETDSDGHPLLKPFKPHHHYRQTTDIGEFVILSNGVRDVESWYDNGWDSIALRLLGDPATIRYRESWWSRETSEFELWLAKSVYSVASRLNEELPSL